MLHGLRECVVCETDTPAFEQGGNEVTRDGPVNLKSLHVPIGRMGTRYYAEIDDQAPVTREGQWIFFAQFLHSGGRWERLLH